MNRSKLKAYAPQARRDFIQAVTDRAAYYGLSPDNVVPITIKGDVAIIGGRAFPKAIASKRKALEERISRAGFDPTMEALAYTWFNRLVAIRYMELHGYLEHGYRVLSNPDPALGLPEILEQAEHVDLPGLKHEVVVELKLAGNKEAELYRRILVAQCNALHTAMPFLFEKIDDETELALPESLLHTDSLVRKLVSELDEEDCQEVEIIGWLYQFYISERKDEVIGKVVSSEDIPAATQLFTPNWIVKYLVQNTLGRQWLATYPQAALRQQMEYYIEPAEQTPAVKEQLKAITPTSLNPEDLTLLDPACGSGHILVEAYELFKAIYQERGYRAKDIPSLILQRNLFGLEIDDRAAQLAAFALMMKARADDRHILGSDVKPNIVAIQHSKGMDAGDVYFALTLPLEDEVAEDAAEAPPTGHLFETEDNLFTRAVGKKTKSRREGVSFSKADIASLLDIFDNAKTFGSLIQIPPQLTAKLPVIERRLDEVLSTGDLTHAAVRVLKPLLQQARLLAEQYDATIANPPYMGNKYYTASLKAFVNREYKETKADLYACFMKRNKKATKPGGFHAMINIPNWMFLSSFEEMRRSLFETQTIDTFVHNGRGVFGSDFGSCAFVVRKAKLPEYRGSFRRLFEKQGSVASNEELEQRFHSAKPHTPSNADFAKIPGSPVAYWVSNTVFDLYKQGSTLQQHGNPRVGMQTSNNDKYLRLWWEIDYSETGNGHKWIRYIKGGPFRRWFGNVEHLLHYNNNPEFILQQKNATILPLERMKQVKLAWSDITSGPFSCRLAPENCFHDISGHCLYPQNDDVFWLLAITNSKVVNYFLTFLNPTVHCQVGDVARLPVPPIDTAVHSRIGSECSILSEADWDSFDSSWNFTTPPLLKNKGCTLQISLEAADEEFLDRFSRMKELEEENNRLLIEAYGLQGELSPEVRDNQVTLYRPNREEDLKRLLSYSIGCMMGRYSLDKPGLIYAHSNNEGFDPTQYKTLRADDDGVIPFLETDWGIRDDASNRIIEFVGVVWGSEHLEDNLRFIAGGLGLTSGDDARGAIRRYLAMGFYKHHLSTYKKRPIYWLFSSGKHRAFQCLVYMHRYNESTLGRMRSEYVIDLQGKYTSRLAQLVDDIAGASSTSHRRQLEKERDKLQKQQAELQAFDEKLRHYADKRIKLDLDDGVKVNYAKFGDLLAEAKAVCGSQDD